MFLHPVGTPEGQDERRRHDTIYRSNRRAARAVAERMVEPPPLPPANPGLAGQSPPPPGGLSPRAIGAVGPASDPTAIPWKPELLTSLIEELLKAAEEFRVDSFVGKCEEAGITGKLLEEIERDAHFPKAAKILLKESLPRLAAKWLNRSGVSAEYQDELTVVTALLLMIQNDRKNGAKLDELIAQRKKSLKDQQTNPAGTPPAQMQPIVLPDPPKPFGAPEPVTAK